MTVELPKDAEGREIPLDTETLYDNTGKEIKSWHGKIDLESNDQEVFFDLNGKRVIIQGGIVVSEED